MKIDMIGPGFNKFSEMFDKLYVGREPLYAIITSLENMMTANKINFFKLPAFKSKDFRNHYFIFDRVGGEYVFKECI